MGEKDIAEKILFDYNDVFADVVNVLLFNGERVIHEDDLETTGAVSQYKADESELHEQERDVSKLLKKEHATISLIGFENQTIAEQFMPVRVMGYDGAAYRSQLIAKDTKRIYPIVTMVLYFGIEHWKYSRHLRELVDAPDYLAPFVSDYEMKNLFEIAFLSPEQVSMFQSDFRYVADYFVQKRTNREYKPSPDTITHVDAVLKMMSVFTGDHRFEEAANKTYMTKGGNSMEAFIDQAENRGIRIGEVKYCFERQHYTPQQISVELEMPVDDVNAIIAELKKREESVKK